MGKEATCRAKTRPGGTMGGDRGRCVRNTKRTRVFFLPTSVSPFRSSMSEFLSFRIPAQSMLRGRQEFMYDHLLRCLRHTIRAPESYRAVMLFSGLSGMSRSLVPAWMLSWLAVPTIFPVTLCGEKCFSCEATDVPKTLLFNTLKSHARVLPVYLIKRMRTYWSVIGSSYKHL